MVQPPSRSAALPTDIGDDLALFPAQAAPRLAHQSPAHLPATSASRPTADLQVGVRRRVIRQVVVLEVAGPLADVVEDLDRAIQLALADGPRGVVCDLSEMLEDIDPAAVEVLATAGRHVRDWPGIPVAVACPDHGVRAALIAHPLGGHLMVTASMFSAVSAMLATPAVEIERRHLTPHPTSPRAARDFVTRTLLDWRLGRAIPFATLVVSELVTSSTIHSGTDIDLTIAWNLGALRLTVQDHSPDLPRRRNPARDLNGRGLTVVAGLSRAFGVLPTTVGGKVVWAVLNAARPQPSISVRPSTTSGLPTTPGLPTNSGLPT